MEAQLSHEQITSNKLPLNLNDRGNKAYPDTLPGMYWDFNGALPAAWTIVDNTSNNFVWTWSDIGAIGAYTGTPTWDTPIPPLASSTGGNGFMLFQADNYNTDQGTGASVATPVNHDSYIQTEVLDFSGINSVILNFQQRFRVCCIFSSTSDLYVSVSNDGTTWTDYEVGSPYAEINNNSSQPNDVTDVSLNISNAAANQSTVYIRFHIRGLSHYYWMIDDVAITEGAQFDLVIEDYYNNFFTLNSGSYSQIPQAQAMNGYIGWKAAVFNNGAQDLNNVVLNTEVLLNGVPVFNASSNAESPVSLLPALAIGIEDSLSRDTINLLNDDFYIPSLGLDSSFAACYLGTYDVTWIAEMDETDENPLNNIVNTSFTVNDSVYARDNGIIAGSGSVGPQTWVNGGNDGDFFGVRYEVMDPTGLYSEANSISMYIKPSTSVNANAPTIRGSIWMYDGFSYSEILTTDFYTITQTDTSTWLTLPFVKDGFSEFLMKGDFIVAIEVLNYNGGDFYIGEDITTKQVSLATLWYMATESEFYSYGNYSSTPMIRLNFDPETFVIIANPNIISGKVVIDDNCIMDGTEQAMEGFIVKTVPNNFYGITDSSGAFTILTDTGTYQVEQVIPVTNSLFINPLCPIPNYHTVHFDSLGMDTTGIDFHNEAIACPYLTIDINSNRRRRCFTNNTYVHYCNDGYADASGVEVYVQFPDYVIFVSANYPYTIDTLGNYVFDIGTLAHGDCGDIHIIDSVACINGITGLTQCTEAWITPPNDCVNSLDTAAYNAWDKSSVMVEGECIGDTIIRFTITNTGDLGNGDMQIASEYRVYRNTLLVLTNTFQLLGQEVLIIDIPADGATYRLEADQHPMHPGNSHPNETIENCGNPYNSTGFVNIFPMDDADAEIEIDCMEIIDSYDPNDKSVSPQGITANNYLMPGTVLDYVIRFQNTGSDTAFTVVVIDTLSAHLDVSTFQQGICSHPYTLDVKGQGSPILTFTFNNINLEDSTSNEPNSHGFIKFKIAPYDSIPMGTAIENTAHIYFDYNLPIVTNTTFVTISDTIIHGYPLVIHEIENQIGLKVFPNPFSEKIELVFEKHAIYEIRIIDLLGKEVFKTNVTGTRHSLSTSALPSGTYLLQVISENGIGIKKIVKQ